VEAGRFQHGLGVATVQDANRAGLHHRRVEKGPDPSSPVAIFQTSLLMAELHRMESEFLANDEQGRREYYYAVRAWQPSTAVERAARFRNPPRGGNSSQSKGRGSS
jgi:hypothetical protein